MFTVDDLIRDMLGFVLINGRVGQSLVCATAGNTSAADVASVELVDGGFHSGDIELAFKLWVGIAESVGGSCGGGGPKSAV